MSVRVYLPNPLAALDDRALVRRFADQCDPSAFEQLVKRHGALVLGTCRRAVWDRHLAEDAFQAVFLVLARQPRRAADAVSVGGWLFGVARRVGMAARRHEQRREKYERAAPVGPCANSSAGGEFNDLLRVLDDELAALPEEPRAALVACFLEERTQDEAARELGWSLSTLRRRLDRGKEVLRARLARRGVALAAGLLGEALAAPARAAVPSLTATPSPASTALAAEVLRGSSAARFAALAVAIGLAVGGVAAFDLIGGLAEPPVTPAPTRPAPPDPALTAVPALQPVDANRWVTVSGRVVFPTGRPLPNPRPVPADQIKDADVWQRFGQLFYDDTIVSTANRGLANAVVFLRPDSDDRRAEFPAWAIRPDLANAPPVDRSVTAADGRFTPRVLAGRAGARVTFENRLPVPTNVRSTMTDGDGFNVLLGTGAAHTTKPLTAAHLPVQYGSGIYPWMTGAVWAFDHPYFAVTDADGRFEIVAAPAGAWRVVVWHETGGFLGGTPGRLGTKLTVPETSTGKLELAPLTFESANW
jgi:RNA polymerase sigma factor (sigma-70 family)